MDRRVSDLIQVLAGGKTSRVCPVREVGKNRIPHDGGMKLVEATVQTKRGMNVVIGLAVVPESPRRFRDRWIVGQKGPAVAHRSQILSGIKAGRGDLAHRSGHDSIGGSADTLRAILNNDQSEIGFETTELPHRKGEAVKVDRQQKTDGAVLFQSRATLLEIDAAEMIHINKEGEASSSNDRESCRESGQRSRQHLVAWLKSEATQTDLQRVEAVPGSDCLGHAPEFRQVFLKRFNFRAQNEPAACAHTVNRAEGLPLHLFPLPLKIILKNHSVSCLRRSIRSRPTRCQFLTPGGSQTFCGWHSAGPLLNARSDMKNQWDPAEAAKCKSDLDLRVYSSRLLGRDDTLVLHGGGNTSVKVRERNVVGEEEEILYIKGSGWDLETIEAHGFAPVRMAHLSKLAQLESLSDSQMVNELAANVTRAGAPAPSVETILHAVVPHKFVDHTHADALLAITNTDDGEARIREIYGNEVIIVPYVMPGFELARACAKKIQTELRPATIGMVLLQHGIFSFGATAEESYARMISLVERAEDYLREKGAWELPQKGSIGSTGPIRVQLAALREKIARSAGFPVIVSTDSNPKSFAFARANKVGEISQRGPATPDHIIRTKRLPMLGRDVNEYAAAYREYFARNAPQAKETKTMLDPAPRVVLDPEFGLGTVGRSARESAIARDLYSHTMDVIGRAEALGGYRALSEEELFQFEYWDLEQAKLRRAGAWPMFAGEIACVTGAASGIGKACVEALLKRGAAVAGLDVDSRVTTGVGQRSDYLGVQCDVTSREAVEDALERAVRAFGGLDMLILNAGIFPAGTAIHSLDDGEWRRVFAVNLDANLALMRECYPLLKLAPRGGRVVVIGSKNVAAPGPGAAAYSASKSALTQLARIAALEWGAVGIRVNTLHPNAVFDTGIWTDEVLKGRAASYGMSVEEYKRNNVLKTEVRSSDVGELAAELCGPVFRKTTGAQIPIDGGNERVI